MSWVQEEPVGSKDGANPFFVLSFNPIAESLLVCMSGIALDRVAYTPSLGEYQFSVGFVAAFQQDGFQSDAFQLSSSEVAIRLGVAPRAEDVLWVRYFKV